MSKGASRKNNPSATALQIALPLEWASDTAPELPPGAKPPSQAATPVAEKEAKHRKRKWYSLYDKVYAFSNLQRAWEKVRANGGAPGCDGQTVRQFETDLSGNLEALHEQLRTKQYHPRPVKRVEIPKAGGGTRALGVPSVRDRVVQQAVYQVLSPIFEEKFSPRSHGFRPGRGCETALGVVDCALQYGYEWVVDADISKFFDNVDHELLLGQLNEEIADGSVLRLVEAFLKSGVLMDGGEVEPTELGTPQGGPLSPLLANVYLHPFDVAMREAGFGVVRYADDFVIFANDRERAGEALALADETLSSLKLNLHPDKTRIVIIDEGFEFLGFRYLRDRKRALQKLVGTKAERRFRARIRKMTPRHAGQRRPKSKRLNLQRLRKNKRIREMVERVNRFLQNWYGYFRGVRTDWHWYLRLFDGYIRQRLRNAITGRYAKGRWQKLLPNAAFEALGYTPLTTLHSAYTGTPLQPAPSSGESGGSRVR